MNKLVVFVALLAAWSLVPVTASADCDLTVRLYGCVQDSATHKPLYGARVYYDTVMTYVDDRGCFVIQSTSTIVDGDFFPNYYCVRVYKPGYQLTIACEQRTSILEPFPPCIGSSPLYLSFQYGIIQVPEISTDVTETGAQPRLFELFQNYPNPFNPDTKIGFVLKTASQVRLDVYDLLGRHVARLVEGSLSAGMHEVNWDAHDRAAGVYFYRLHANGQVVTRKMLLLK